MTQLILKLVLNIVIGFIIKQELELLEDYADDLQLLALIRLAPRDAFLPLLLTLLFNKGGLLLILPGRFFGTHLIVLDIFESYPQLLVVDDLVALDDLHLKLLYFLFIHLLNFLINIIIGLFEMLELDVQLPILPRKCLELVGQLLVFFLINLFFQVILVNFLFI